jgi:O-antigen/teichoic acid export membrane protein
VELKNKITFSFLWNILLMGISFLNNILITHILLPEERGEYVFFISNATLLNTILSIGLFSSVVYFGSSQKANINRMFFSMSLLFLSLVFITFFVVYFGEHFTSFSFLFSSENLLYLIIVNVFFTLFSSLLSSILLSQQKINEFNIVQLISPVLMGLLFIIFQFKEGSYDADYLVKLYTASLFFTLLVAIYFVFIKHRLVALEWHVLNFNEFKAILAFGLFNFVSDIVQFLNYRIDYWFVKLYVSSEALGIYSFSSILSQLIWVLPSAISTVLFPWVASLGQQHEKKEEIMLIAKIILLICLIGGLLGIVLLKIFIPIFFSLKYADAVFYYSILIIGTIPYCYSKLYASVIAGMNKISVNFKASLLGFCITLVLNFTLTKYYGAIGASVTSVISYIASTLVIVLFISREWNVSVFKMFWIDRNDIKYLATRLKKKSI